MFRKTTCSSGPSTNKRTAKSGPLSMSKGRWAWDVANLCISPSRSDGGSDVRSITAYGNSMVGSTILRDPLDTELEASPQNLVPGNDGLDRATHLRGVDWTRQAEPDRIIVDRGVLEKLLQKTQPLLRE